MDGAYYEGLYASRIHSSADEISSLNRSPSLSSSDEESLSRYTWTPKKTTTLDTI